MLCIMLFMVTEYKVAIACSLCEARSPHGAMRMMEVVELSQVVEVEVMEKMEMSATGGVQDRQ